MLDEGHLTDVRRHDVGHDVTLIHGIEDLARRMTEAQHPVATAVINHGALQRDDPGSASAGRDVGVYRVDGIEVDDAGLHGRYLLALIEGQEIGARNLQLRKRLVGLVDGVTKIGTLSEEPADRAIVETGRRCIATMLAHLAKSGHVEAGVNKIRRLCHGSSPEPLQGAVLYQMSAPRGATFITICDIGTGGNKGLSGR